MEDLLNSEVMFRDTFVCDGQRVHYLTEDLSGLRLIEQANNDSGVLTLGSETEKKSHRGW